MKCEDVRPKLSWYVDGELDYDARRQVAEHAGLCGECGAILREYLECGEEVSESLAGVRAPRGLGRRVMEAVASGDREWWRGWTPGLWTVGIVAASTLLLAAGAVGPVEAAEMPEPERQPGPAGAPERREPLPSRSAEPPLGLNRMREPVPLPSAA